jgi:hypothetical protein
MAHNINFNSKTIVTNKKYQEIQIRMTNIYYLLALTAHMTNSQNLHLQILE